MIEKIRRLINLTSNMGLRYVFFRVLYLIKSKSGLSKRKFPVNPSSYEFITLKEWREDLPPFFFYGKNIPNLKKTPNKTLSNTYNEVKESTLTFFNKTKIELGSNYDWITHPLTGYKYNIESHWSEIQDFSKEAGDIKYVWEKSRFTFLYDIIRYDFHFEEDQSKRVLNEIIDFIDKNPINKGPNYKCSQEISLRIMNWTFALYYYKDSPYLSQSIFNKVLNSIYWQIHHVYNNINFSRITVRNNHAITETLMLYLSGKLFPFFPKVNKWSKKGKKWFEQEIEYQIAPEGTFIQHSMNYHRVVIQLLTWGIQIAKLNNDKFNDILYERAEKSLRFLDICSDTKSGLLPNYGSNDGALFFKLTDTDFRNYRPQLDDLRSVLKGYNLYNFSSLYWYGLIPNKREPHTIPKINNFYQRGYYIMQDQDVKTFIRCGSYKNRPAQSDNLHIDIWCKGENVLWDTGSYRYNTKKENTLFFRGCQGHNTLSVGGKNQMLKGERFIWYYWVKKAKGNLTKVKDVFYFKGEVKAFKEIGNNVFHVRDVEKKEGELNWIVKDRVKGVKNKELLQFWQINPKWENNINFECKDLDNNNVKPIIEEKFCSNYYGVKEKSIRITFATKSKGLNTQIIIKE